MDTDEAVAVGFEAVYVAGDGAEHRVSLAALAGVRLEDGRPVRSFPSYRGQRNYPGWYWSATMGRRVGFESWVERLAFHLHTIASPIGATNGGCGCAHATKVYTAAQSATRLHGFGWSANFYPDFYPPDSELTS